MIELKTQAIAWLVLSEKVQRVGGKQSDLQNSDITKNSSQCSGAPGPPAHSS